MATVNLKTAGDALVTNATAMAAQSGASLTAANLIAIGHMLAIMDNEKGLGMPPLLKLTATDLAQLTTTN
jgi:hypothetical protein